ncbi:MAG: S41 family peptidase [Dehalococcoidia bacterium]
MRQRSFSPLFLGALTAIILLVAVACGPIERLQRLRERQTPSQVPQELSVLWDVWQILARDYGGKESIDQRQLSEGAIQGMLDFLEDEEGTYGTPKDYDLDTPNLGAIWQAWQDITDKLEDVGATIDLQKMPEAAIRGMLSALGNPYTSYLSPEYYQLESTSFKGDFEGIGAWVNMLNGQLTIVAPMPDAPAEQAGIIPGDIILEVDGTSIAGLTLVEATLKIRGPRGTPVELLILHPEQENPQPITVVRDAVIKLSVYWEPLEERFQLGEGIAYLQITQFLDNTDEMTEEALREIMAQGYTGLILDVRHNLGGLLDTTVAVASQFLTDGLVLYQVDAHGKRTDERVREGGVATEIPIVILTDELSASGSEVLVGALQDHQRATAIGTKTFGKGSVNELRKLNDGSGLYLTAALWYTPNGRLIEGKGLEPDIEASLEEYVRGDTVIIIDRPLEVALEHLNAIIAAPVS